MPHPFLSDVWLAEVREMGEPLHKILELRLNLEVTGGPEGDKDLHVADLNIGSGHLDGAKTTVTISYATARRLMVEGDQPAMMQAFMSGEVKIQGDMSMLMGLMGTMAGSGIGPEDQQTVMAIFRKQIEAMTTPD